MKPIRDLIDTVPPDTYYADTRDEQLMENLKKFRKKIEELRQIDGV